MNKQLGMKIAGAMFQDSLYTRPAWNPACSKSRRYIKTFVLPTEDVYKIQTLLSSLSERQCILLFFS